MQQTPIRSLLCALTLATGLLPIAQADTAPLPATMRLDYQHSGNALGEHYAIERVLVEPLPWPGNPARPIDDSNRGNNLLEVVDIKSGKLLYSRGFSTIFGEWASTDEAKTTTRAFQESVRFPQPEQPVRVRILKRDERGLFSIVWSTDVDPAAQDVIRKQPPAPVKPIPIRISGPSSEKVDLLIMGDGYTAADMGKFEATARKLAEHLF
ncbi:MAG: peptidase M64, partial [Janthinobacterium lividum]|nr:peptidase M64 [Janthinobacterium lividum]